MFGKLKGLVNKVEAVTGKDLDGDGKAGGKATKSSGTRSGVEKLDDGAKIPVSTCDGNKKSLFVGINYTGHSQGVLKGCINDVKNIKDFVVSRYGFPTDSEHMRTLTDDQQGDGSPTKANMLAGMKWLVQGAKKGDSLFFHFSGHGGTQKDVAPDTDEADKQDETLIPLDYQENGVIVDDQLHELLVAALPEGVRLTVIVDACHSGSVMDLPYTYTIDGNLQVHETDNRQVAMQAALAAGTAYFVGDKKKALAKGIEAFTSMLKGGGSKPDDEAAKRAIQIRTSMADVVQLSGCRDDQTSADANIGGESTGAMSHAFVTAMTQAGDAKLTYTEMLGKVREILLGKYKQVPQLSAGHKMDLGKATFMM